MSKVAYYCRLSEEDRNKSKDTESESIKNQKKLLEDYAKEKGWEVYDTYIDEDWSGSERARPEFNRLIRDAEARKFDIVLCKKQNRFCRDSELVERYIHGKFVLWGIRFVSIVDHADTNDRSNKKARQVNALIDEWYLEDESYDIKCVFQNKRLRGEYIGAFALYGFKKDPANKNHLLVDKAVTNNVQTIFNLYEQRLWSR